jgi:hypothetical protein
MTLISSECVCADEERKQCQMNQEVLFEVKENLFGTSKHKLASLA